MFHSLCSETNWKQNKDQWQMISLVSDKLAHGMSELCYKYLQCTWFCQFKHLCSNINTDSHHPCLDFLQLCLLWSQSSLMTNQSPATASHRDHKLQPWGRLFNQTQSHQSCWSRYTSALPGSDGFVCCCEVIKNTWMFFYCFVFFCKIMAIIMITFSDCVSNSDESW